MRTKEEVSCPDIECTLCKQYYDREMNKIETEKRIKDFHLYGYSVCPRCHQPVSEETQHDAMFKKNVDRFIKARSSYFKHYKPKRRRNNVCNDNE